MSLGIKRKKTAVAEPKIHFSWKEAKRQKSLLIWSGIIVIYGIIFYYLPLGGWVMAFQNYRPIDGLLHSEFVGLQKFQQLFSDATFLRVIRNTLAMGVINLVVTFVAAIAFAILLNEVRNTIGKKTVQTISYLPHFLSWIIVTGIIHDALSGTGIINELLVNLNVINHGGVVAHGGGAARNFVRGLSLGALGGKRRQKSCVLGGSGLAAHDLVHHGIGFVVAQVLLVDDLHNGFLDHFLNPPYFVQCGPYLHGFFPPGRTKTPPALLPREWKRKTPPTEENLFCQGRIKLGLLSAVPP